MTVKSAYQELVFATHNANKVEEVRAALGDGIRLKGLHEYELNEELPETHETLRENAVEKAHFVYQKLDVNCFAEDTGLEVDALNGEPGVYSARYAGPEKDPQANIALLLERLKAMSDRKARFRTVIALYLDGSLHTFEGMMEGEILPYQKGQGGFGYDPVFRPKDYHESVAEMDMATKNAISHRGKAITQLSEFLNDR